MSSKKAKKDTKRSRVDWEGLTRAECFADPALLTAAPPWWPHLFDDKSLLGRFPFPITRAFAIIDTRACEVCGSSGVSRPPRSTGLRFGLWGHDACVQSLLTDVRALGSATNAHAAGVPTLDKKKNPHGRGSKQWTLTLARDQLHPLIPPASTYAGVAGLSVAAAHAAGEKQRAELAAAIDSFKDFDVIEAKRARIADDEEEAHEIACRDAKAARVT